MEYDKRDRVTKTTDPLGNATEIAYDGLGRRTIVLNADGQATYYQYDPAGRRTAMAQVVDEGLLTTSTG